MPALPLHDSVEVPDPLVIEVGERVQFRPEAGETVRLSATVPMNPLIGATVIVEFPA